MLNEYRREYQAYKESIDRKVLWNLIGAVVFIAILVFL